MLRSSFYNYKLHLDRLFDKDKDCACMLFYLLWFKIALAFTNMIKYIIFSFFFESGIEFLVLYKFDEKAQRGHHKHTCF